MVVNPYVRFVSGVILFCLFVSAQAGASLSTVKDLRELKHQAESANLPVLLMFTAADCEYCEAIRNNYLIPMINSGKYSNKILFKQLYIDEYNYLRNEKGELAGGDQVALKYDVEVTPTIVFINAEGKEVSERIVCISGAEYFDRLLDQHISQAGQSFKSTN